MDNLSPHTVAALQIARDILTPGLHNGEPNIGEVMVMLETVTSVTLLTISDQNQAKAQGLLDALQDGASRRMMMNDGKPYHG